MTTLTLHNLDPKLSEYIRKKAATESQSLNKTAQKMLAKAAGIQSNNQVAVRRKRFKQYCGIWTKKDLEAFEKNIQDQEKIYPKDWV